MPLVPSTWSLTDEADQGRKNRNKIRVNYGSRRHALLFVPPYLLFPPYRCCVSDPFQSVKSVPLLATHGITLLEAPGKASAVNMRYDGVDHIATR